MKIALIWPNPDNPWPPKGWGAIEKYIWEYKTNFDKLGVSSDIRYSNSYDLNDFDMVIGFTWNQSLNLYERNIPYINSFDDIFVIRHGKDSDLFRNNIDAIKHSIFTLVHGEYLIDFYGENNIVHLRHGANPDIFRPLNTQSYMKNKKHKLLCVGRTDADDRKGIEIAINAAQYLNLPITIVGPNDEFFSQKNITYDKLSVIGNSNDNELSKIYNDHTIFLHPSNLETGHPNLTLIESIYCGTPVVGTCDVSIKGMKNIKPNKENLIQGINEVIDNYMYYKMECINLRNSHYYDWYTITKDLLTMIEQKITLQK